MSTSSQQPAPRIGYVSPGPFSLNTQAVDPPMPLYVRKDEIIQAQAISSVANTPVVIAYKMLMADGQVIDSESQFTPLSSRGVGTSIISMEEGYLLSLIVRTATANVQRGQLYVIVQLGRGNKSGIITPTSILISDYLTTSGPLGWQVSPLNSSLSGAGFVNLPAPSQLGAGTAIQWSLPTNTRWRIRSLQATLVTAVAAANRTAQLLVTGSGGSWSLNGAAAVQVASLTWTYNFAPGLTQYTDASGANVAVPIPQELSVVGAGALVELHAVNMQAADNFTLSNLVVEEWLIA